jgi:hypothetical protein
LIKKLKQDAGLKHLPLLGYLSHVQTDLALAAQETGCDTVLPRSAFSMNMPQIFGRYSATP